MKYQQLREKLEAQEKYPGCVRIGRAPLINPGFPGNFNLSFAELPWLNEYGGFVDFDHDYVFSTIQSCVRPEDIPMTGTDSSWKYLGVFEMGDLGGIVSLKEKSAISTLHKQRIKSLIEFLETMGVPKKRVHPLYCAGGHVRDVTRDKYCFDFIFPEDTASKEAFLEAGVPEQNLISDSTRDSALCLHIFRPTPRGYRIEVNVDVGSAGKECLVDVATIENLLWTPVFWGNEMYSKNIIGLQKNENEISICVVGLERLCMVINDLERIQDVDYIKPFYEELYKELGRQVSDNNNQTSCGEGLRALHRIYSDITTLGCCPGRHQKAKIRKIMQNISASLSPDVIRELLTIHSDTQPWHINLKEGVEPTIERINRYREC